jgi:hypothetical protein
MWNTINEVKMDNASIINQWMARFFSKTPKSKYTAEIDVTDLLKGNVSGTFKESQKNKPSPSSHLSYQDWVAILGWGKLQAKHIERSFIGWTNSMEPTMDHGDMVLKVPYGHFKGKMGKLPLGSICIYQYGNMGIIHRYIGTSGNKFIFKGDNNFRADPPVKEEQITHVMIAILHTKDKLLEGQD